MKTIFIPTPPFPVGGSRQWLDSLSRGLPHRGWRVILGVTNDSRWDRSGFLAVNPSVQAVGLNSGTRTPEGCRRSIRRAIRKLRPDVVVPHLVADTLPAVAVMKREMADLRLVVRCQEIYPPIVADAVAWSPVIDAVVVVSRFLENVVAAMTDFPKDRILRAPGGVRRVTGTSQSHRGTGPIRIGYAGRLEDDKRAMDLVPFCEGLDSRRVAYRLDIVGVGSRESELRRALAKQIAEGKVRVEGLRTQEELYSEFYPSWDLFVLFSPAEGLPFAPLEALLHGIVPVVSDFTGRAAEGILRHRESSLVFPVGDTGGAADLVAEVSKERGRLALLGEQGRSEVEGKFTEEGDVDAWDRLLNYVIEQPPRVGRPQLPVKEPSGRLDRWFGSTKGDALRALLRPNPGSRPWSMATREDPGLIAKVERVIETLERSLSEECVKQGGVVS